MSASTEQLYDEQVPHKLGIGCSQYILNHTTSPRLDSSLSEPQSGTLHIKNDMSGPVMEWERTAPSYDPEKALQYPFHADEVHVNSCAPNTYDSNTIPVTNPLPPNGNTAKKQRLKLSQPKLISDPHLETRQHAKRAAFQDRAGVSSSFISSVHNSFLKVEDDVNHSSDSFASVSRLSEMGSETRSTPNESMTSMSMNSSTQQDTSPIAPLNPAAKRTHSMQEMSSDSLVEPRFRPRSSIPMKLPTGVYGQQCVTAAYASRLNPYALHADEHRILRDRLCHLHITVYLNIRNGILRLWTRNPMVNVTREEAVGCAKDHRWIQLASFAYDWLVRKGYINFGCVEIPWPIKSSPKRSRVKDANVKTIVVVGAGMSGLGCARQLHGLLNQYHGSFTDENPAPRIVILEGRKRIGGRIYSHPLTSMKSSLLEPGTRSTAEMGAQIITGFEHGNPLDVIVRGQLALRYHSIKDVSTLYDTDGTPIGESHDLQVEKLYNDILDRCGYYRHTPNIPVPAEGDHELIDSARDSAGDDGLTIAQFEEASAAGTIDLILPRKNARKGVGHKAAPVRDESSTPNQNLVPASQAPAALAAQSMGWQLKSGVPTNKSLVLDDVARSSNFQSLGSVMDEGVAQYQDMINITPKDLRLMNWHFANLEYANAANIGKLSLASWDQDTGNEFEGEHAEVVGGYQQVVRGLLDAPNRLDVRTGNVVKQISYHPGDMTSAKARVICESGEVIEADKVVLTSSLGVLKDQSIRFEPPLPSWKLGAIDRLGFGLLNKVILVFDHPFWDVERDMIGVLREPIVRGSLNQEDYVAGRGQLYLFWNIIKTSGLPVLVGLMAGDAAHRAEQMPDDALVGDCLNQLRNIFGKANVPEPTESLVTRWKSDRFARGSYSYVADQARPGDYDLMAKPIGNLFFAGEATCGSHPATVHGAYISGLRAASEVLESLIGYIEDDIPYPLVPPRIKAEFASLSSIRKKAPTSAIDVIPEITSTVRDVHQQRRSTYEQTIQAAIVAKIGARPVKPSKSGINPFLIYQKDHWRPCKERCDAQKQAATGNAEAKAGRDEVRAALGAMWRTASDEERKPYIDQTLTNRQVSQDETGGWKEQVQEWENKAKVIREQFIAENPFERWSVNGAGGSTSVSNP